MSLLSLYQRAGWVVANNMPSPASAGEEGGSGHGTPSSEVVCEGRDTADDTPSPAEAAGGRDVGDNPTSAFPPPS